MRVFIHADCEVVWFYVAVDDAAAVDILDALDHLVRQHEQSLHRELFVTLGE